MRGWISMAEEALKLLREIREELVKLNAANQKPKREAFAPFNA